MEEKKKEDANAAEECGRGWEFCMMASLFLFCFCFLSVCSCLINFHHFITSHTATTAPE